MASCTHTTDAAIYSWAKSLPAPEDLASSLAMTLHDHAVTDALEELMAGIDPARTVGVMGGHALPRGSDDYVGAARLASQLTLSGYTVLTGGGPGAMEAANLGAYLAGEYAVLSNAIDQLSAAPDWQGNQTMWVATALDIRAQTAATGRSIGVPTWFYGHEPSNVFATAIAKYFSNALREDLLLQHCRGGLIYPAGRGRHRPGGLPGCDRQLLLRRSRPGMPHDLRRRRLLDPPAAGLATGRGAWPGPDDGRAAAAGRRRG